MFGSRKSGLNRGKNWNCKDAILSFNKASDAMKELAISEGMKISYEEVSEYGHKMFRAYAPQSWTPEKGHTPSNCSYSHIECFYYDHGNGKIQGRIEYNRSMPYGHGLTYMDTYDQK